MSSPSSITRLIRDAAAGNRAAFEDLYDQTSAKLYGVCLRILKDEQAAEDALQDAYINIWRRADTFVPAKASPMAWLCAIARNQAIDQLRRQRIDGDDTALAGLEDERPNPEDLAATASDESRLHDCIDTLQPHHARYVRGAYFTGHSYDDLARLLKTPVGTIKSAVNRSLAKLRDCVERAGKPAA